MEPVLSNTATGRPERVYASNGRSVRFYCCGPTVYGPAHIGNFRTFLVQDLFRRVCEAAGLAVTHVRNVTDVDDKTIRESRAAGESLADFAAKWRARFAEDCAALNLLPPHHEPSAVDHVADQIALIGRLIEGGHAYRADDGSVYFRVSSFDRYGELARIDRSALRRNAEGRQNADDEYSKDDVADFALWKAKKPEDGENHWESPWGPGRPGWHIECSAMSLAYLGDSIDVHGGGIDLAFPHHENEIAQSECATGHRFVRHWFHSAHLMVEGEKMSKSLGNLHVLADLTAEGFHPAEIRWALLSGHYRKTLNFTRDAIHAARRALGRLEAALASCGAGSADRPAPSGAGGPPGELPGEWRLAWAALLDDLNVPKATGHLMKELARCEKEAAGWDDSERRRWTAAARFILGVLGIDLSAWAADRKAAEVDAGPPEEIRRLAEERWAAKREKDFATADRLRDEVAAAGWRIKDTPDGYEIEPASS